MGRHDAGDAKARHADHWKTAKLFFATVRVRWDEAPCRRTDHDPNMRMPTRARFSNNRIAAGVCPTILLP
jgi:hypothetical protein